MVWTYVCSAEKLSVCNTNRGMYALLIVLQDVSENVFCVHISENMYILCLYVFHVLCGLPVIFTLLDFFRYSQRRKENLHCQSNNDDEK